MVTRTFFIVQHGEKRQGQLDPGLTARGHRQADAVALALRGADVSHVRSSPLRRARQTAAPLARALDLPVVVEAGLTERMTWFPDAEPLEDFLAQWRRTNRDRDHQPPTGDSSRTAGRRFEEVLRALVHADAGPGGSVVVVTHGGVTVDFLRTVVDDAVWAPRIEPYVEDGVPGGAITEVSFSGGVWRLHHLARLDHVGGADRSGHRPV